MTTPNFTGIRLNPRPGRDYKERIDSLAFNRIVNGNVEIVDDSIRQRMGRRKYPEYSVKGEGYTVKQTATGQLTSGKGGYMYTHPDPNVINRSRLFCAFGNKIYMYDITNDTFVIVRDVEAEDSGEIEFMSAVQAKVNLYMAVGDGALSAKLFKYSDESTGAITAYATFTGSITAQADNGSGGTTMTDSNHGLEDGDSVTISGTTVYNGTFTISNVTTNTFDTSTVFASNEATGTWVADDKTLVTDASHGMVNGNTVVITGTTSYDGTFVISAVGVNSFVIGTEFVADDATGTWTGHTVTSETMTGLNAPRLLGSLDNRIMAVGTGDNNDKAQYSKLKTDGNFSNFASSTATDGGGLLSGSLEAVTAMGELKGFGLVSENRRITVHTIGTLDESGTGRIKDTQTINNEATLSGIGTESSKGLTTSNDNAFIVTKGKGIYKYDPLGRSTANRLTDLSAKFRPLLLEYDLSDSSILEDEKNNKLRITASSEEGIGADTMFNLTFDTKSWAFDTGKQTNQIFFDVVNQRVFGLGSTASEIHELYDGQYQNDGEDVAFSTETVRFDAGDRHRNKRHISTSLILGASDENQEFLIEWFVDDDDEAYTSETVAVKDFLNIPGTDEQGSGESTWDGGTPAEAGILGYLHYFYNEFIPDFERLSIRVTETSPFKSSVHDPKIKYSHKDDELDSFHPGN